MHWIKAYQYYLVPFFILLLTAVGKILATNNDRLRGGRGGGGRGGDRIARGASKKNGNSEAQVLLVEEETVGVPKAILAEERMVDGEGDGVPHGFLLNDAIPTSTTTASVIHSSHSSSSSSSMALTKAIEYLHEKQVKADMYRPFDHQWEGNFPQFFRFLPTEIFGVLGNIPEISPFIIALIYDGLVQILESNHAALQLDTSTYRMAREMRMRAAKFMKRFQSVPSDTQAEVIKEVGTYGFWPKDPNRNWPPKSEHVQVLFDEYITSRGTFYGDRVPVNPAFMWPHMVAIPPDADDTALVLAALLDHQEIDGGSSLMDMGADGVHDDEIDFATFFADWRDAGEFAAVTDQSWKQKGSGAFVTWINYQNSSVAQDVDLVVNANILYLLGRTGKQDTPGFDKAVQLINMAAEQGIHRTQDPQGTRLTDATFIEISSYYVNNHLFQYTVSRAYTNGVTGLQPAVQIFVDDLQKLAIREDNLVHWDLGNGAPIMNTAFAILTLMNALEAQTKVSSRLESSWPHYNVLEELIQDGAAWLVEQQTEKGDWDEESVAFYGSDFWPRIGAEWISRSWTVSTALQAIARSMLHDADAMSTRNRTTIP